MIKKVLISLTEEQLQTLDEMRKTTDTGANDRSELIRRAIDEYTKKHKKAQK